MKRVIVSPSHQVHELVINWHITEACNYRCRYCFAKWDKSSGERELIHDVAVTSALLQSLFSFFRPDNLRNPLRQRMSWQSVRLNLAGGEPLLYGDAVVRTIKHAREIGFDVSLISNGSRLNAELMAQLAPHLTMLGLSLDSAQETTCRQIGRADRYSFVLSAKQLAEMVALARCLNPRLKLKINTVVNALNWREDMQALVGGLAPEKWKVLQMLPTVTEDLVVSKAEYTAFVSRHQALSGLMCIEDNDGMAESYVMVDPHGCFFQNALGRKGYDYSAPILEVGAEMALSQVSVSSRKFCSRYAIDSLGASA